LNKEVSWLKSAERRLGTYLGRDISTPAARRRAMIHFQLLDHGILRALWHNLHEIAPGVWRSNQPSPRRLRKYQKMGFRTVFNLRGANGASPYLFEKETCDAIGLTLVSSSMNARQLVSRRVLLQLLDQFQTLERPFVMHCKSGADRAGLVSALYLLHVQNTPIAQAKKQLSIRYLHLRSFQTGILDHMLDAYETDIKSTPMPIRDWIKTCYDREKLTAEFNAERAKP